MRQWPKLGNETIALPPDAQHLLDHQPRTVGRLQRLAEDHIIEGVVGIVDEVGVGIALDDRQAARHAFVDALLADLDAAAVDRAGRLEQLEQGAVAAADVEHPRSPAEPSRR